MKLNNVWKYEEFIFLHEALGHLSVDLKEGQAKPVVNGCLPDFMFYKSLACKDVVECSVLCIGFALKKNGHMHINIT